MGLGQCDQRRAQHGEHAYDGYASHRSQRNRDEQREVTFGERARQDHAASDKDRQAKHDRRHLAACQQLFVAGAGNPPPGRSGCQAAPHSWPAARPGGEKNSSATEASLLNSVTTTALTPLAATILRGIDIDYPSLHVVSLLTPAAAKLYPQTLSTCLGGLALTKSFGGLPLNQLVLPSANIAPAIADLAKNDPGMLKIGAPGVIASGPGRPNRVPRLQSGRVEVTLGGR